MRTTDSSYTQLYRYDRFIEDNSFLCKEGTEKLEELESNLLKLKQLEYYSRYGEYLARVLMANRLETDGHEQLHQYWTAIHTKILAEGVYWEDISKQSTAQDIPILIAVWAAAKAVGLREDRVEWLIQRYAEITILTSFTELLSAGRWCELATILYYDGKEFPMVIPPDNEFDLERMTIVVNTLKARYFIVGVGDEHDSETWRPNDDAGEHRRLLRATSDTDIRAKMKDELVKTMRKKANETGQHQPEDLAEPMTQATRAIKINQMEKLVGI